MGAAAKKKNERRRTILYFFIFGTLSYLYRYNTTHYARYLWPTNAKKTGKLRLSPLIPNNEDTDEKFEFSRGTYTVPKIFFNAPRYLSCVLNVYKSSFTNLFSAWFTIAPTIHLGFFVCWYESDGKGRKRRRKRNTYGIGNFGVSIWRCGKSNISKEISIGQEEKNVPDSTQKNYYVLSRLAIDKCRKTLIVRLTL